MLPINLQVVHELSQEYQHNLLREAEAYRLIQSLSPTRATQWARGVAQLGQLLINCGAWLKRRCDPARAMQLHSNY